MQNKIGWFSALFCAWIVGFLVINDDKGIQQPPPAPPAPIVIPPTPIPPPVPPKPLPPPVEPDCIGVQVPIPKACRVYNRSGSQCVWCSIQCLALYHGVKDIQHLTDRYTWATGPGEVSRVLGGYPNVKWKQIQNGDINFIKKYVTEKKLGVGLAIPGHMLNLVHYDEEKGIVKVIDNCGPRALQVQDWSMSTFKRKWDGWALVVFPPGYVETSEEAFDC